MSLLRFHLRRLCDDRGRLLVQLATAAVLALGIGWMTVAPGTLSERVAEYRQIVSTHGAAGEAVGMATLRTLHLAPEDSDRIFALALTTPLQRVFGAHETDMGLYPLRAMLENWVLPFIGGILLLGLLWVVIRGKGGRKQALVGYLYQVAFVLIGLNLYPYYDAALANQVATPLVQQLSNRALLEDAMRNASELQEQANDNLAEGLQDTQPGDLLSGTTNTGARCAHGLRDKQSEAWQECFGPDVPEPIREQNRELAKPYLQSPNGEEVPEEPDRSWTEQLAQKAASMVADFFADSFFGMASFFLSLANKILLWLIAVVAAAARGISLIFAGPLLVFALWPKAQNLAIGWYKGHTFALMFTPLALFTIILMELMFFTILTAGTGGGFAGIAAKGMMLWMAPFLFLLCSWALFKVSSGTTAVGSEMIVGGLEMAGEGVQKGAKISAQVAGTAVGGPAAGAVAGQAAEAATSPFKEAMDKGPKALAGAFGLGAGGGSTPSGSGAGRSTAKAGAKTALKYGSQEGFSDLKGMAKAGLDGAAAEAEKHMGGAEQAIMDDFRRREEEHRDVVQEQASVGDAASTRAARLFGRSSGDRRGRRALQDRLGLSPAPRGGEVGELSAGPEDVGRLVEAGASQGRVTHVAANRLANRVVLEDHRPFDITVTRDQDGETVFQIGDEAFQSLSGELGENKALREHIFEVAAPAYGGNRRNVPTIELSDGTEVPDLREAVNGSDEVLGLVQSAVTQADGLESELHRRELVGHRAGVGSGTAAEAALRGRVPTMTHQMPGEGADSYEQRLKDEASIALHAAQLMDTQGLSASQAVQQARSRGPARARRELGPDAMDRSLAEMSSGQRSNLEAAVEADNDRIEKLKQRDLRAGGLQYGLDMPEYVQSGQETYRGMPDSRFERKKQSSPDLSDSQVYSQARSEVENDPQVAPDPDQLSARNYERRLNELVFLNQSQLDALDRSRSGS